MSLRAIWRRIWHPTGFVGRDLQGTLLSYISQLPHPDVPAGNAYYERANPLKSSGELCPVDFSSVFDWIPGYIRSKRSVKYRKPDDMWNYIGGSKRLPSAYSVGLCGLLASQMMLVQWSAWLAHTRAHPPSIEVHSRLSMKHALLTVIDGGRSFKSTS